MKVVLIVIFIDLCIFCTSSLFITRPSMLHYEENLKDPDHFGYDWKIEVNH